MTKETENREFERYSNKLLKQYQVPGFSLGLGKDGECWYEKGFGFRDREEQLPLSPDTVFGIGSITKAFTAVAILQLQEKGKLSVHDPVTCYLPEFKTSDEEQTKHIKIHHFLTHSSGLPSLPTLMGAIKKSMEKDPVFDEDQQQENPLDSLQAIDTYAELMGVIAKSKFTLLGVPGTEFGYSNDAYALLGAIIARVSGESYEQYVEEHILKPIGMHNSTFQLADLKDHTDIAVLYDIRPKEGKELVFRSNNPWDAPAMRAAGFLKSTVNDMLKFTEMIRNEGKVGHTQILSPESVTDMTTPYIQCEQETWYGYGVTIVPDFFGYKLVHHGGDIKGVTAHMGILPEIGLTGIALANIAGAPSSKLLFGALADYLGKPVDASHLHVEVVARIPEQLKEYEGTFLSGEGMKLELYVENEKLHVAASGLPAMGLKPIGKDLFLCTMRETDFTVRFVRNEDNNINRIAFAFRQIPKIKEESK